MDKLKVFLVAVKKFQFWILCGVMLITTLVCWWLATAGLAGQFRDQTSKIKNAFDGTKIPANQANQAAIDKISGPHQQHDLLKQNVFNAWKTLYDQQKEKNPFPTKVLGEDFKKQFESLPRPPRQGRLDSKYLARYQRFIKDYLPDLLKMIDVRQTKDAIGAAAERSAGFPPMNTPPAMNGGQPPMGAPNRNANNKNADKETAGIVEWNSQDLERLFARFQWTEVPSVTDVVLAQEDLWVYEALLRVIKSVNETATSQTNASVKRISALRIGKDSRDAWKNFQDTVFRMGRTGPGGMPLTQPTGYPDMSAMAGDRQYERELFADRYVDDKGQPLPLKPEYPYVEHVPPEYKMMPIYMSLLIDQRCLPKLLAECANSNMPIEVKHIRIRKMLFEPVDMEPAKGGGSGGGGMAGGMGVPGARSPRNTPTANGIVNPEMNPIGLEAVGEFDVPVEIYAIIYIYNPPDREKLGMGAASTDSPPGAAGSVDPAASKSTTPTPPPNK